MRPGAAMSRGLERRKAAVTRKELARLHIATLDQHFDGVLRRVRANFEQTGEVPPGFECVADGEIFQISTIWPDRSQRDAACSALRECFRRRGVTSYVFASEGWVGKTPGLSPTDDPARGECVHVIAVERNGPRRCAVAEIMRYGETATLGPWQMSADQQGWLMELLEEGHSDRSPKAEPPPVERTPMQDLLDHGRESVETRDELGNLMTDQVLQEDANGDPYAVFMALEGVLRSLVKDLGSPKFIGEFARFLRDYPDIFPMFPNVPESVPSIGDVRRCKSTLQHFICEKREAGRIDSAIFGGFLSMYLDLGSQVVGALHLAGRIETWDPENQAKLRQVGLRSSYELDDEEGYPFFALCADRYPLGVMGRRNAIGELFVSAIDNCRLDDFATAVQTFRQKGIEVITGAEARELICKLERVKGFKSRWSGGRRMG
jgi:hypothetical protein